MPFKAIHLSAVSESLAPSELFGHVRGAFTDARAARAGAFQSASHGTLFLDEIGKASIPIQQLLLRAVEEKVICAVGSDVEVELDVRLMAATSIPLSILCEKHGFLSDLGARFGTLRVVVPPLRKRREDIPHLARLFVAKHAAAADASVGAPQIHPALMAQLQSAQWPLNLRQLDSTMQLLVIHAEGAATLEPDHCIGNLDFLHSGRRGRPAKRTNATIAAVVANAESKADAARTLGVSRATVNRYLKRAELRVSESILSVHKSEL